MKLVGFSHGTFYAYFKNKRDILWELVNGGFTKLYEATEDPWRRDHSYDSLHDCIKGFFVMYKRNLTQIKTWKEAAHTDMDFMELWKRLGDQITSRIQANIEYSIKKGTCRKIHPKIAAKALASMIDQYANNSLVDGDDMELDLVTNTIATIWHNALYLDQPAV